MGTFGFSRVEIVFAEETPVAFQSEENMLKEVESGLQVNDFECNESYVAFEVSSGRLSNLDWQVKQVVRYIRDKKIPVEEINCSAYSECDSGSFQYNGEGELDEYDLDDE
jgi:hypothetical protein